MNLCRHLTASTPQSEDIVNDESISMLSSGFAVWTPYLVICPDHLSGCGTFASCCLRHHADLTLGIFRGVDEHVVSAGRCTIGRFCSLVEQVQEEILPHKCLCRIRKLFGKRL